MVLADGPLRMPNGEQPRVALVSNSAFGEQASRLRWAVLLQERGYQVRYVLPSGEEEAVRQIQASGVQVDCYPLERRSPGPMSAGRTVAALTRTFSRQRFHIVHTFAHEPAIYGAVAARMTQTPVVVTQVTGLGRVFADDRVRTRQTMVQRSMVGAYRLINLLSTAVVFHNPDDARILAGAASSKAFCLPSGSGVDVSEYSPTRVTLLEREALRRELGISDDAVVITSVGRLVRHKGIDVLLAAAELVTARFPNARFLIVGGSDSGNERSIELADLRGRISSAIQLTGERSDIRSLLAITDIFVNPSPREGLPRASMEAMAMSKPVVALDVPGSRETVEDGLNGYLTSLGEPVALAGAIGTLVADAAIRDRMGAASRQRAIERFRVERSVDWIDGLYRRCLSGGTGPVDAGDGRQPGQVLGEPRATEKGSVDRL